MMALIFALIAGFNLWTGLEHGNTLCLALALVLSLGSINAAIDDRSSKP
jgi:hypothetical protein